MISCTFFVVKFLAVFKRLSFVNYFIYLIYIHWTKCYLTDRKEDEKLKKIMIRIGRLTRKEGETLTEQEIRDMGVRCALRHMDFLRMQAAEEKKADFIEPCKNCPDIESCNCNCSIKDNLPKIR